MAGLFLDSPCVFMACFRIASLPERPESLRSCIRCCDRSGWCVADAGKPLWKDSGASKAGERRGA